MRISKEEKGYTAMLKRMVAVIFVVTTSAMNAGAQASPNYSAGSAISVNQLYQAPSDGFIVVTAIGSYENNLTISVGATAAPSTLVWAAGDDLNGNTKASSAIVPIAQGMYYKIANPGYLLPYIQSSYGFETVIAYFYPANAATQWVTSGSSTYNISGNVGIGTTTPQAMLDVAGNIKISGTGASVTFPDGTTQSTAWNGTTCGGDYAESVDVTGERKQYEPGEVLVIDAEAPDKFEHSSEPYSKLVAGVYSTKPGLAGRRQGKTKTNEEVPMALVGIVPTKVSAENGQIKPGDLLVSSNTSGYAMRGTDSEKMRGAVIGKAMGTLKSGTGVIEVLVSLQ